MKQILQEHIKEVVDIDDSTLIKILDCFFEEKIARGKYLIKTPQICDYYIFICHGVLKMSFEKNDTEVINWIAFERHFFTILESYINESPSEQDLIALEDTDILIIPKVKMEVLLREYPVWQLFLLKTYENAYLKLNQVLRDIQTKTPDEIYEDLSKKTDVSQRVKLKDLSNMMGITPHTLSRIRRRRK